MLCERAQRVESNWGETNKNLDNETKKKLLKQTLAYKQGKGGDGWGEGPFQSPALFYDYIDCWIG